MRRLQTLELRVDIITSIGRSEDYVARLIRHLRLEKEYHAEWEMPSIIVVDKWKGEVVVMDKNGTRDVSGNFVNDRPGSFPSTMINELHDTNPG